MEARPTALAFALVLLALVAVACGRNATPGARGRTGLGEDLLAGLELRDHDDQPFLPARLAGKLVLVNFLFTRCPTVCPTQTQELAEVQGLLPAAARSRLHFLSISVDPEHDTPEALRRFARAHGVDVRDWSFVTMPRADLTRLAARVEVFDPRTGRQEPAGHRTSLYLFDAGGQLVQRYAGIPVDRARLVRELQELGADTASL